VLAPQWLNAAKQRPCDFYGGGYRGESVFIGFSPHNEALCSDGWSGLKWRLYPQLERRAARQHANGSVLVDI
jgi:hypothetical protein